MIKGIIFDLDGTLLDSMWIWENLANDYLISLGITPKEDLNKVFETFSLEQSAKYYIDNYDIKLSVEEIIEGINKMISNYYEHILDLKVGVKEFLKYAHNLGIKMCVATATSKELTLKALDRCNILKYFTNVFTCGKLHTNKENPLIYQVALKHLNLDKKDVLVFEDSYHAIKTVVEDGFKCVCIYDKYEKKENDIRKITKYYYDCFNDIDLSILN